MKRSEMVEKLARSVSIISGGLYTKEETLKIASDLLKQMEDEGMQPPFVGDTEEQYFSGLLEWEPEDETL